MIEYFKYTNGDIKGCCNAFLLTGETVLSNSNLFSKQPAKKVFLELRSLEVVVYDLPVYTLLSLTLKRPV